ncbi:uncharacterized protein C8Q71DRAFT_773888 [Rhodofomes roseus]|uniref:Uncharacterized protein n=1 Tax=Rhodofomes roseus TaxID=34475 RepID=A0ABQ8K990_9APHY|nr:uncharacterized protein C8Q71DRAFT_773888 [Rhodofomes roseus]KAH9833530.1 hypothetical protein C8Q71DRAFT_773888 [Rhodofomes roseus]
MTPTTRLPAEFTSLYRLVLRATAASVLNNGSATQQLRVLWRPGFDRAAEVLHRLQSTPLAESERTTLQRWYGAWEARMDKTLSFLSNSARSRGLPHRVTRNMSHLLWSYRFYTSKVSLWEHDSSRPRWKPNLPQNHDAYKPHGLKPGTRLEDIQSRKARRADMNDEQWAALDEVILMAEGREGLSLGRITRRQWA